MKIESRIPIINYTNRPPNPETGSLEGGVGRILSSSLTPYDHWIGVGNVQPNADTHLTHYDDSFVFKLSTFTAPLETRKQHYNEISLGFFWPFFHMLNAEISKILDHIQSKDPSQRIEDLFSQSYTDFQSFLEHANTAYNQIDGTGSVGLIHDFTSLGIKSENALANAFYLHVPFPELSWVKNLKIGSTPFLETDVCRKFFTTLTEYDVIGFQTKKDSDRFIDLITYLDPSIQHDAENGIYAALGNKFLAKPITIGINPLEPGNQARTAIFDEPTQEIVRAVSDRKVILSVARNDYTKGTAELADTIDQYFSRFPNDINRVTFVVVRSPSRQGLIGQDEYHQDMNIKYADLMNKYPGSVIYVSSGIENSQLMRFMRDHTDILIDLPTSEEGHGLSEREFVDVNPENSIKSVILTKGVGASEVLNCNGQGAFLVNDCHATEQILESIHTCLNGSADELRKRFLSMKLASKTNSGENFLNTIIESAVFAAQNKQKLQPHVHLDKVFGYGS